MSQAQKKDQEQEKAPKKESKKPEKVELTDQEKIDQLALVRRKSPHYAEGLRAYKRGESVCTLTALEEGNLPIEWLYGFIDGMAEDVRNFR